ncbi:MAG: hypothetical protein WA040_05030 [Anaerolineae bacterium]
MAIEQLYVVDTNALIWYLTKHRKLSQTARDIFAAAERGETLIVISSDQLHTKHPPPPE